MIYKGSKRRLVKHYKPIIEAFITEQTEYIEPFVGGCNMITEINANIKRGNDINKYLIALLKYFQSGCSLPVWIDEEEYKRVRSNPQNYPDWYVGYVGFICSYRGGFFKGYNGIRQTKRGICNYQEDARNNFIKTNLNNIVLSNLDYRLLNIKEGSVVYCDAPYKNTDKYKGTGEFDYNAYYEWLRGLKQKGCKVFISEIEMLADYICIKEVQIQNCLNNNRVITEKLFTL